MALTCLEAAPVILWTRGTLRKKLSYWDSNLGPSNPLFNAVPLELPQMLPSSTSCLP